MRDLEKTTENFERLDRQEQPGFEPGISHLPILSATTPLLVGQKIDWKQIKTNIKISATENIENPFRKLFVISSEIQLSMHWKKILRDSFWFS